MLSIIRFIWGLLSRGWPVLLGAMSQATAVFVAGGAARTVAVAAALTAFVLWLPMPGWLASLPSLVGAIPASVAFAMSYAKVDVGVSIVLGAYVLRFVARLVLKAIAG